MQPPSPLFALLAVAHLVSSQTTSFPKANYTGTLSSLDGGLSGTITVTSPTTLLVTRYTLEDASAPALYWWGTANSQLRDGFRISNTQVTKKTTGADQSYTIMLDAGKTVDDFGKVGLWCEKFGVNFGEAELKSAGTAGTGAGTGAGGSGSGGSGAGGMKSEGAGKRVGAAGVGVGLMAGWVAWLMM
jgi:hypothetical protein